MIINNKILFSVIIPSYNKQDYISRAINSVLKQTYQNFEIVIIDDGSTDDSVNVIKTFKDNRIKLFVQKNLGVNNARNRGINESSGEYVAFLDADDELTPDFLNTIYKLIYKYPGNSFFGTAFERVYFSNVSEKTNFGNKRDFIIKDFISAVADSGKFFIHISSIVIKKDVFNKIGRFFSRSSKYNSGLTIVDDLDLWIRISSRYNLVFSNKIGCIYYTNTPINVIRGYGFLKPDCTFYENTILKLLKTSPQKQKENLKQILYKLRILSATQFTIRNLFDKALQILKKCDKTKKEAADLYKIISIKKAEQLLKKEFKEKILFVNPLWSFQNYPPINIVELATYLKKNGLKNIKLLDLNFEIKNKLKTENVIGLSTQKILSQNPVIVAITCNAVQFPFVCELSKNIKRLRPEIKIIVGGVMPSLNPKLVLKLSKADFAVRGEGELSTEELVKAILNNTGFKNIKGISYITKQNKFYSSPDRELADITKLPIPDFSLIKNNLKNNKLVWLLASRGCAYKCKFCSGNNIWHYQRRKNIEYVYRQLNILKTKYGITNFVFGDDCLTLNKNWLLELCKKIKPLKMKWGCLARIDTIDAEILQALKMAGCKHIYHGIESGSPSVRQNMDKQIKNNTNSYIYDIVKKELASGFLVTCSFMTAIPFETKQDMAKTYKLAKQLQQAGAVIQLWILTPYHGLQIIKEYKKQLVYTDRTDLQTDIFDKGQFYLYRDFIDKYKKYNPDNFMFLPKGMNIKEFTDTFIKMQKGLGLVKKNIQLNNKEIFILKNIAEITKKKK